MPVMTTEEAIIDLTTQTTELLNAVNVSKTSIDGSIAAAVLDSENAALEPLVTVAKNLIDTQTIFVNYIIS
tara:strand:- start:171 stop:383 length:213 start_codon:yes stop_codon:yes gene_type:complete